MSFTNLRVRVIHGSTGPYADIIADGRDSTVPIDPQSPSAAHSLRQSAQQQVREAEDRLARAKRRAELWTAAANLLDPSGAPCGDCGGEGRGGSNTTDGGPDDDCASCSAEGVVPTALMDDARAFVTTCTWEPGELEVLSVEAGPPVSKAQSQAWQQASRERIAECANLLRTVPLAAIQAVNASSTLRNTLCESVRLIAAIPRPH